MCRSFVAHAWSGVLGFVVLCAGGVLRGDEPAGESAARKVALAKEQAIRQALDERTAFDFDGTPLHDVAAYFAEKHKVQIVLDKRALDDVGVASDTGIVQRAKDVSLRSALDLILRDHDLTYLVQNEVLSITTADHAAQTLNTVVYDVHDLLELGRQENAPESSPQAGYDYDSLIEVITSQLEPTMWDEVGGPASVSGIYGTLVISQTQSAHEQIGRFLADMRAIQAQRKSGKAAHHDDGKKTTDRVGDDVNKRFAQASLGVAEAELAQSQEANRRVPATVSQVEVQRLEANVDRVRAQLAVADAAIDAGDAAKNSVLSLNNSPSDDAIRRALDQKTSVDFNETPLVDAIKSIGDKHGIQVILDKKSLDNQGIGSDTPITGRLKDISLRSALKLLLEEHGLIFVIRDEVLFITTRGLGCPFFETVIYDVRDLLDMDRRDKSTHGDELPGDDFQSLIDMMTTVIAPTSWDTVGGEGSVAPIYGMLVVNQSQSTHEEVARLLAWLRKVRAARGDKAGLAAAAHEKPLPPQDPQALTLRIYKVIVPLLPVAGSSEEPTKPVVKPAEPAAELKQMGGGQQPRKKELELPDPQFIVQVAAAVTAVIEPESWDVKGGKGVVRTLPADAYGQAALVVRQTAGVHRQIERFLKELQAKGIPSPGGVGGGFF